MNQVQEILATLPPLTVNNSRNIFLDLVRRFEESPSDRLRHRLEEFGMVIDFDDYLDHRHDIIRNEV